MQNLAEKPSHSQEILQPQYAALTHLYAEELVHHISQDGEEIDRKIIEDNIFSLRRTTEKGRHDVVFDPASGRDALRLLLAYDSRYLIAVDSYLPTLQESKEGLLGFLKKARISYQEEKRSETLYVVTFILDRVPRSVVFLNRDARDISIPQVDVWHSYLPTGAEQETEKQREARKRGEHGWIMDDHSPIVHEGFSSLNWRIYSHVQPEGFISMNEDGLLGRDLLPVKAGEILGFQEFPIQARHPSTVLTMWYSSERKSEYRGVLTQKKKSLTKEQFSQALEILEEISRPLFLLKNLEQMQLYYFKDGEGSIKHPIDAVLDLEQELEKSLRTLFPQLESDPSRVEAAVAECRAWFRTHVEKFQERLKDFFELLAQNSARDREEQRKIFGVREIDGIIQSEKYPFAEEFLRASPEFLDAFRELAQFSWDET